MYILFVCFVIPPEGDAGPPPPHAPGRHEAGRNIEAEVSEYSGRGFGIFWPRFRNIEAEVSEYSGRGMYNNKKS